MRYVDLKPCYNAFIDTRSPGSEAKENFTIIGPGVSENPEQFVHIAEPHGFNIGGARQPPGCVNSQHSHDTAEVFLVHSGQWRFDLGETGQDAQLEMGPGDVISIPTGIFRGFTNIGTASGFLWAVLGEDDPGRVLWAPAVFEMAKAYGLVLLETGQLIDTAAGQNVPEGVALMPSTTAEQVKAMHVPSASEAQGFVARFKEGTRHIIHANGALAKPHGFTMDQHQLVSGQTMTDQAGGVIFVHEGGLSLTCNDGALILAPGDTLTIPATQDPILTATAASTVYVVKRAQ